MVGSQPRLDAAEHSHAKGYPKWTDESTNTAKRHDTLITVKG